MNNNSIKRNNILTVNVNLIQFVETMHNIRMNWCLNPGHATYSR